MPGGTVNLVFVVHNHQPVGNFDHVFARAADDAYLPFLRLLMEFPGIRIGLHTSGCLWDWLAAGRPEYIELAQELHHRGQIEILGGGYYEPILTAIPQRDLVGQFKRMDDFCTQRFGIRPDGFWCTERVWSPALPYFLEPCGKRYTLLDDNHFISVGIPETELDRAYLTSHLGGKLSILPISERMRYLIPFKSVDELEAFLRTCCSTDSSKAVVFGDDGEKFGVWPGTAEWVWTKGWMRRFFEMLSANSEWINFVHPGEYLDEYPAVDLVHLPATSYREMTGWALPAPAARKFALLWEAAKDDPAKKDEMRFLRGGHFENFFSKYTESERMEREMLYVSGLLESARPSLPVAIATEAGRLLYEGQCNCAYWHGVFGGLYLNYLRHSVYRNLTAAKRLVYDNAPKGQAVRDDEYVRIRSKALELEVRVSDGAVEALDFLPTASRITDVLTRRFEAYHEDVHEAEQAAGQSHESIHQGVRLKEAGLESMLVFDGKPRVSFDVSVLSPRLDAGSLMRCEAERLDAPRQQYSLVEAGKTDIVLSGRIELSAGRGWLAAEKTIGIDPKTNRVKLGFVLDPKGMNEHLDAVIAITWNFGLLAADAADRYYLVGDERLKLSSAGEIAGGNAVILVDEWQGFRIEVESREDCEIYFYPILTVSASEGGLERTYQGSAIVLARRTALSPGGNGFSWEHSVNVQAL